MEMATLLKKAGEIQYVDRQSGSPAVCLVFLHGAGGSHLKWKAQLEQLPLNYRLLAPDLPGHGGSGGTSQDSIKGYADAMAAFLQTLDIPEPVIVGGQSMGAAIALQLVLDHPEMFQGLFLVGAGARLRTAPAFLEALDRGEINASFLKMAFAPESDPDMVAAEIDSFASADSRVLFHDFTACDRFDVREEVKSIKLPTLVATGAKDQMAPPRLAEYLADNIGAAELKLMPGAGHFPMMEIPAAFNQELCAFVDKVIG